MCVPIQRIAVYSFEYPAFLTHHLIQQEVQELSYSPVSSSPLNSHTSACASVICYTLIGLYLTTLSVPLVDLLCNIIRVVPGVAHVAFSDMV